MERETFLLLLFEWKICECESANVCLVELVHYLYIFLYFSKSITWEVKAKDILQGTKNQTNKQRIHKTIFRKPVNISQKYSNALKKNPQHIL